MMKQKRFDVGYGLNFEAALMMIHEATDLTIYVVGLQAIITSITLIPSRYVVSFVYFGSGMRRTHLFFKQHHS
jgi:hypothetical protein